MIIKYILTLIKLKHLNAYLITTQLLLIYTLLIFHDLRACFLYCLIMQIFVAHARTHNNKNTHNAHRFK